MWLKSQQEQDWTGFSLIRRLVTPYILVTQWGEWLCRQERHYPGRYDDENRQKVSYEEKRRDKETKRRKQNRSVTIICCFLQSLGNHFLNENKYNNLTTVVATLGAPIAIPQYVDNHSNSSFDAFLLQSQRCSAPTSVALGWVYLHRYFVGLWEGSLWRTTLGDAVSSFSSLGSYRDRTSEQQRPSSRSVGSVQRCEGLVSARQVCAWNTHNINATHYRHDIDLDRFAIQCPYNCSGHGVCIEV